MTYEIAMWGTNIQLTGAVYRSYNLDSANYYATWNDEFSVSPPNRSLTLRNSYSGTYNDTLIPKTIASLGFEEKYVGSYGSYGYAKALTTGENPDILLIRNNSYYDLTFEIRTLTRPISLQSTYQVLPMTPTVVGEVNNVLTAIYAELNKVENRTLTHDGFSMIVYDELVFEPYSLDTTDSIVWFLPKADSNTQQTVVSRFVEDRLSRGWTPICGNFAMWRREVA